LEQERLQSEWKLKNELLRNLRNACAIELIDGQKFFKPRHVGGL
jgi:hypothetical protein